MIIHYSEIDSGIWQWDKFTPKELSCPCCGEFYLTSKSLEAIDRLHFARIKNGNPFLINSAHRCIIHNARVGGAPLSEHKKLAFDVSTRNHGRIQLKADLASTGFSTFGLYQTFIHTDPRPGRLWYGKGAKKIWNG